MPQFLAAKEYKRICVQFQSTDHKGGRFLLQDTCAGNLALRGLLCPCSPELLWPILRRRTKTKPLVNSVEVSHWPDMQQSRLLERFSLHVKNEMQLQVRLPDHNNCWTLRSSDRSLSRLRASRRRGIHIDDSNSKNYKRTAESQP